MTRNQKIFADEYCIDRNGARAYKVAYPNIKNNETAAAAASRTLVNVNITAYIEERLKLITKKAEVTVERVIREISTIAFSDMSDYAKVVEKQAYYTNDDGLRIPLIDEQGNPVMYTMVDVKLTEELTEEQKRALSTIKQGKSGIEVSTYDKLRALDMLGKNLGIFKENIQLNADMNINNPYDGLTVEQLKVLARKCADEAEPN